MPLPVFRTHLNLQLAGERSKVSALTGEVAIQVCSEGNSKFTRGCRELCSFMVSLKHMVLKKVVVKNLMRIEGRAFSKEVVNSANVRRFLS